MSLLTITLFSWVLPETVAIHIHNDPYTFSGRDPEEKSNDGHIIHKAVAKNHKYKSNKAEEEHPKDKQDKVQEQIKHVNDSEKSKSYQQNRKDATRNEDKDKEPEAPEEEPPKEDKKAAKDAPPAEEAKEEKKEEG